MSLSLCSLSPLYLTKHHAEIPTIYLYTTHTSQMTLVLFLSARFLCAKYLISISKHFILFGHLSRTCYLKLYLILYVLFCISQLQCQELNKVSKSLYSRNLSCHFLSMTFMTGSLITHKLNLFTITYD